MDSGGRAARRAQRLGVFDEDGASFVLVASADCCLAAENAIVVSVDEKPSIQAPERRQDDLVGMALISLVEFGRAFELCPRP